MMTAKEARRAIKGATQVWIVARVTPGADQPNRYLAISKLDARAFLAGLEPGTMILCELRDGQLVVGDAQ